MKSFIKSQVFKVIAATGLPRRIHPFLNQNQISILMYHGIIEEVQSLPDWCFLDVASFRDQLRYLKKHFEIISLDQAVKSLRQGSISGPTAVITFDDGYQNNFDLAFPVLCEENIPATIFLATSFIDSDKTIWTGALQNAFEITPISVFKWRGVSFKLSNTQQKLEVLAFLKSKLKKETYSNLKLEVKNILYELIGIETCIIGKDSPYRILDSKSISRMARSNLIDFGAHTHTHPILGNLTKEEQEREILRSIETVNSLSEKPCSYFAYPNGRKCDYNLDTLTILENSNIQASLTTIEGTSGSTTPILELRRFSIGSDMDMAAFKLTAHNFLNRMRPSL